MIDIPIMSMKQQNFKVLLGQEIERKRIALNYGVRELAKIADIEHHQLINIEKGRVDIRISTLLKIATAFNLEAKDLLTF